MIKLIFKAYKKTDKTIFLYIKMLKNIIKNTKKSFLKRLVKGTKIFLKKKKTKGFLYRERYRNLSEEEKEKKHQYGLEQYKKYSIKVYINNSFASGYSGYSICGVALGI